MSNIQVTKTKPKGRQRKTDDERIAEAAEKEGLDPAPEGNEPGHFRVQISELQTTPPRVGKVEPVRPDPDDFEFGAFLEAPSLTQMVEELRSAYPEFWFINAYDVSVLWKERGAKKNGKAMMANAQTLSGLTRYYAPQSVRWLIVVAYDHTAELNASQMEALLYHEMLHLQEEEGKPILVGHDLELFAAEIEKYGLWHRGFNRTAEAVTQLRLPIVDVTTGEVVGDWQDLLEEGR